VNVFMGLVLAVIATTTPARPQADRTAPATTVEKVPVFVQSEVHDAIGALYVARFRDALEASSGYRPVTTPAAARFVVGFLTMDPNEADASAASSQSTVAAVTLQRETGSGLNELVYSWVLVARRDKVDSLVTELASAIDQEIRGLEVPTIRFLDDEGSSK
jgi:hypothetical protein